MSDGIASLLLIQGEGRREDDFAVFLRNSGYTVREVHGLAQGRRHLAYFQVDAVLLDLDLPGDQGFVILEEIAAQDIPVIVLARREVMSNALEALRLGACDYIKWPSKEPVALQHALNRAVDQARLRREIAEYAEKLEEANRGLQTTLTNLKTDLQAGRHVQFGLLPDNPKRIDDLEFSHAMLPSMYLSGDFVEYFKLGDQHALFFIADVSGHGASSAFVTVMLKNLFARKRSDFMHRDNRTIWSPAKMLARANRELLGMEIGKHVTMCVGLINTVTGALTYSIAGHLPLPVLIDGNSAHFLEGHSMPVGLFPEVEYQEYQAVLPENGALVLFSDGILEVMGGEDVADKEQHLLDVLVPRPTFIEDIVELFRIDQLEEAPDDIAVLLISRS